MVKVFIACGWVAAGLNFLGNLLVATRVGGLNQPVLRLVDPRTGAESVRLTQGELTVALLVIALGIYRRNRVAALAMLIIFAITRMVSYGVAESLAPVVNHFCVGLGRCAHDLPRKLRAETVQ